jgi:hypothetical protein
MTSTGVSCAHEHGRLGCGARASSPPGAIASNQLVDPALGDAVSFADLPWAAALEQHGVHHVVRLPPSRPCQHPPLVGVQHVPRHQSTMCRNHTPSSAPQNQHLADSAPRLSGLDARRREVLRAEERHKTRKACRLGLAGYARTVVTRSASVFCSVFARFRSRSANPASPRATVPLLSRDCASGEAGLRSRVSTRRSG